MDQCSYVGIFFNTLLSIQVNQNLWGTNNKITPTIQYQQFTTSTITIFKNWNTCFDIINLTIYQVTRDIIH